MVSRKAGSLRGVLLEQIDDIFVVGLKVVESPTAMMMMMVEGCGTGWEVGGFKKNGYSNLFGLSLHRVQMNVFGWDIYLEYE